MGRGIPKNAPLPNPMPNVWVVAGDFSWVKRLKDTTLEETASHQSTVIVGAIDELDALMQAKKGSI